MSHAHQGTAPLSLAGLGRELGADPTAMYRHYRNKDELQRGMADRVYGEVLDHLGSEIWSTGWRHALGEIMRHTRLMYLKYPTLALDMAPRFTGGEHEHRHTQQSQQLLTDAGLPPAQAAHYVRALAETTLGYVVISARLMTLPEELQLLDADIGWATYPSLAPTDRTADVSDALADEQAVFELVLETLLDGIQHAIDAANHPGRSS